MNTLRETRHLGQLCSKLHVGCSDGSIQIFMEKQRYMKPDRTLRTAAHTAEITGMAFSGNHLATRGASELKLWDIRALSDKKGAVKTWTEGVGLSTMKAGIAWHNDILCTATESQEGGDDQKKTGAANVVFFDVKTGAKVTTSSTTVQLSAWLFLFTGKSPLHLLPRIFLRSSSALSS